MPTEAAHVLLPHAQRTLAAAAEAAPPSPRSPRCETGTVRFGIFGTARLYMGAALVADVLERHPGLRVELIGQNSSEVLEELRRGRLEAAMISLPVADEGMTVRPVAREELVYISADPERLRGAGDREAAGEASLVLPETTWRTQDAARLALRGSSSEPAAPADAHRGGGRRDRGRAGRPRAGRLGGAARRPRGARPAARAGRRLGVAAAAALRQHRGRAPQGRGALARRAADRDRGFATARLRTLAEPVYPR